MSSANRICFVSYVLLVSCIFFLNCVQNTSVTIESDAILQILDFFDKQNKLYDRQKRYEFQEIVDIKRLNRKKTEVTVQYVIVENYMTVDRTAELKQQTFLLEWQDQGRLVVPPEGEAQRVHWVLTKTWDYHPEEGESSF